MMKITANYLRNKTLSDRLFKGLLLAGLLLCCMLTANAQSSVNKPKLEIGDQAPPLLISKWLKGKPVNTFEKGRIYIVEFWATWCGPCKWSTPHLSKLADKYKDKVTVIGVNVLEGNYALDKNMDLTDRAQVFVDRLGDGMNYTVGMDNKEDTVWKSWALAANRQGIPVSFLIDGTGRIVWIGHPSVGLEEMLAHLVETGELNTADIFRLSKIANDDRRSGERLKDKALEARKKRDVVAELEYTTQYLAYPLADAALMGRKYVLLLQTDKKQAANYAKDVMKEHALSPLHLISFTRSLLKDDSTGLTKADYQVAVEAMEIAARRAAPFDFICRSTLASAYYKNNKYKAAVREQEEVMKTLTDPNFKQYDSLVEENAANLELYKKALLN